MKFQPNARSVEISGLLLYANLANFHSQKKNNINFFSTCIPPLAQKWNEISFNIIGIISHTIFFVLFWRENFHFVCLAFFFLLCLHGIKQSRPILIPLVFRCCCFCCFILQFCASVDMVYLEESLCNAPMNLNVLKFNDSYQYRKKAAKRGAGICAA